MTSQLLTLDFQLPSPLCARRPLMLLCPVAFAPHGCGLYLKPAQNTGRAVLAARSEKRHDLYRASKPEPRVRAVLAARPEKRCGLYLQPGQKRVIAHHEVFL